jgi:hypothetical protein
MIAKRIVFALLSAALVSCTDPASPDPEPTFFSYDMSVSGSVSSSFSGLISTRTIDDGYARGTTPTGPITATDATNFTMVPEGETVGLSVTLFGPFEAGTYELLRDDEPIDPTAKRFEVYYSARTAHDAFQHFRVTSGTVTVAGSGANSRVVGFSFAADSAEIVERGRFGEIVSAPIQISASLIQRGRS